MESGKNLESGIWNYDNGNQNFAFMLRLVFAKWNADRCLEVFTDYEKRKSSSSCLC
jgi:hypothetical protein